MKAGPQSKFPRNSLKNWLHISSQMDMFLTFQVITKKQIDSDVIAMAREAGLRRLIAEVLPENTPMLKIFERCGLSISVARDPGVVHVTLDL